MTCARNIPLVLLITVLVAGGPAHACTPPERPFLPASREDMRAYADLIRGDFEAYIADEQDYFRKREFYCTFAASCAPARGYSGSEW